ncbi:TlpA family protein disulfide reductase [Amycolatopsis umgeniensis]|uniref:Thiol-disulfide isomerase/thioredoxin n=1 Tax=Amycolatopsis umgeniensis TaxID=336628 RepID=A0A841BG65_9PSEU|nr:TlpA disulfide reductase family protein [Amycolatopsis umgeniensis]MBB5857683.1 thiol-disulfide isomerase/thioredoxin [Amycolatopsis umgeniensis]
MSILTAAVVLVGLLCVLDLLLSFGIIRRLREQNEALKNVRQQAFPEPDIALPAGATIGAFSAVTAGGTELSNADIDGSPALVGFFSPGCEPCKERMPQFIEYATRFEGKVVAIAAGSEEETADMVVRLGEVAEVILELDGGVVHKAFGASGYPALCLVNGDRTMLASGWEMSALPTPATL